jgi:hypothetical protein
VVNQDWIDTALRITGGFEGSGYNEVAGNFDGQGLSVGVLQWNYGQETLQAEILLPFIEAYGIEALDYFFPAEISSSAYMKGNVAVSFARANMLTGIKVKSPWQLAWKTFLMDPWVLRIQKEAAKKFSRKAENYMALWGLHSIRAFCWFFDVVVQNGSMKSVVPGHEPSCLDVGLAIEYCEHNKEQWRGLELDREQKLLLVLSHKRALLSNYKWRQDVMDRKGTIAVGHGYVHGRLWKFRILASVPVDDGLVRVGDYLYSEPALISLLASARKVVGNE